MEKMNSGVVRHESVQLTTELFHRDYAANLALVMRMLQHYKAQPHSINKQLAMRWVNAQKNRFRRQLALRLLRNTVYIRFEQLFFGMRDVVKQVLEYIASKYPDGHTVYLLGERSRSKSNYILMVMAWYWLKQMRKHDKYQFEFVAFASPPQEWWQRFDGSPVVYFDDMSYSGGQITHSFRSLYFLKSAITHEAVPDFVFATYAMTKVAEHKLSTVAQNNVTMDKYIHRRRADVAAGRITQEDAQRAIQLHAIRSLSHEGFRDFIPSPFKVIYHRLVVSLPDAVGLQDWYYMTQLFQAEIHAPSVCAYFDYKIADTPSTFQGVLLYGLVPPVHWLTLQKQLPQTTVEHSVFHQLSLIPEVVQRHIERAKSFTPIEQLDVNFDRPDTVELIPFLNHCGVEQLRVLNPSWDADLRALTNAYHMQCRIAVVENDSTLSRKTRMEASETVEIIHYLFEPNIWPRVNTACLVGVYAHEQQKEQGLKFANLQEFMKEIQLDYIAPDVASVVGESIVAINNIQKYKVCPAPFYKEKNAVQVSSFNSPPTSARCNLDKDKVTGFYAEVLSTLWLDARYRRPALERLRVEGPRDFCDFLQLALPELRILTKRNIRLVDTIQSGARGAVLLGVDPQQRQYAVKFTLLVNDQTLQDVHLEANAMRKAYKLGIGIPLIDEQVVHMSPNIGLAVLLMPVVDAVLKQFLQRTTPGAPRAQPLPPGVTEDDVVRAVLDLIQRMEEHKVMHNDFHPGNIVLMYKGLPKVEAKVLDVPRLRSEPCFTFVPNFDAQYLITKGLPRQDYTPSPLLRKLQTALLTLPLTSGVTGPYTSHVDTYNYAPLDPSDPKQVQQDARLKTFFNMDFEGYRYPPVAGCRR